MVATASANINGVVKLEIIRSRTISRKRPSLMDIFNPQRWVDSSGGLTKGKIYGAPHVDISILHGGSQSSSSSAHQGCASALISSTQPIHSQFSLEEVVQWLKQSPDIPEQTTAHRPPIDHVITSSQPTVPTSPYVFGQSNVLTQATMPAQLQQMGFSLFNGTFPHLTDHGSIPVGANPFPMHYQRFQDCTT